MPDASAQDHKLDLSTKGAAHHVDRMLDKAVEDSFPASDPVALSMPHDRVNHPLQGLANAANQVRNAASQMQMPSTSTLLIAGGLLAVIALLTLRK